MVGDGVNIKPTSFKAKKHRSSFIMNKKTNICSESPGCVPCVLLYGRATVIGRTSCVGVDKWRFFRLNMGIRLEECGETTLTHVVTQYELRASLFVASKEKSPTFC